MTSRSCMLPATSRLLLGLFFLIIQLPFPVLNASLTYAGTNSWSPISPGSDQVRSLVFDPETPTTIYAGADNSRVLKSKDSGTTWNSVYAPELYEVFTPTLAINPVISSTIYAGIANALITSADGGINWGNGVQVGLGGQITSLAIDSVKPQNMYAANYGFYRSIDGGINWQRIDSGLLDGWVHSIALDPNSPATIYASTDNLGGVIKKSTDGGVTWDFTGALIPPPVFPPCPDGGTCWYESNPPMYSIQALVVSPSTPGTIYTGTSEGLFVTVNGGANWQEIDSGLAAKNVQAIAVSSLEPGVLYVGTTAGVFISIDGGLHWADLNAELSDTNISTLVHVPTAPPTLYATTAGGLVFKTTLAIPAINGTPPSAVAVGSPYLYVPTAIDATSFRIDNLPSWAAFDTTTGTLSGTPASADVGTSSNIVITAVNSFGTASLPAFSITAGLPKNLTLTVNGTGGGTVTSSPNGIACINNSSRDCSAPFPYRSKVTLYANPASNSTFGDWSGDCQGTAASCVLDLAADLSVTATFNSAPCVKIGAVEYPTLQAACSVVGNAITIQAREMEFAENLVFASSNAVLSGGFDAAFNSNTGKYTTIVGSLKIRAGRMAVDRLFIR